MGGGGSTYSVHRLLWGAGVRTTRGAAQYINRLIEERVGGMGLGSEITFLDMGCGVGGTLFRLAEAFPKSQLHGITISPTQFDIASRISVEKGLQDRCRVHLGDFQTAQLEVEADVIVSIESFAHARSRDRFFSWAAEHLSDRGYLILADDFLGSDVGALDRRQHRHVADFQNGWRLPGLCSAEDCRRAAAECGFESVSDADLTPLIRLGRPRDLAIALLGPAFRHLGLARLPFFGNMIGGNALRVGLRDGLLEYRLLVFRRLEATVR